MAASKSSKSPAYQHYPADFLGDDKVARMSYTEIGIYQVLLDRAWLGNGLPTDVGEIAKMLKLNPSRFLKVWRGVLSECWQERGGRLVNPRQERERKKQIEFRRRQADNGAKGGRPRQTQFKPTQNPSLSSGKPRALKTEEEDHLNALSEKLDVAFAEFRDAYPRERRKGGLLVEQDYLAAAVKAGGPQPLMDALRNHAASEQWANPRLIPGMDVWLREERWRQTLPPSGASPSGKTLPAWAANAQARKAAQS